MKLTSRSALAALASVCFLALVHAPASAQARAALVQNIDEPGRNPFILRQDTTSGGVVSFAVPAGKRYVIEQYTGNCAVPTGVSVLDIEVVTTLSGVVGFYSTQPHYSQNVGFGLVTYSATGVGPIYADAGSTIDAIAAVSSRASSDFHGCTFVLSGHVINNP